MLCRHVALMCRQWCRLLNVFINARLGVQNDTQTKRIVAIRLTLLRVNWTPTPTVIDRHKSSAASKNSKLGYFQFRNAKVVIQCVRCHRAICYTNMWMGCEIMSFVVRQAPVAVHCCVLPWLNGEQMNRRFRKHQVQNGFIRGFIGTQNDSDNEVKIS